METILQKPNYGDYRLWRPNTETPYYLRYMYIDSIGLVIIKSVIKKIKKKSCRVKL